MCGAAAVSVHRSVRCWRRTPLVRRLVLTAVVAVVGLVAWPGRADAHPTLLLTSPAADTAEAVSPSSVVLVFNEPVTIGAQALNVTDAAGHAVGVDQVATARGATTLTGHLIGVLPAGVYTVRWRATGADGDLEEASFRFAVGTAITGATGSAGGGGISWPSAGLRWLLLAGLALVLGGALGARITAGARMLRRSLPAVGSWAPAGAALGLIAAIGLGVLLAVDTDTAALSATAGRIVAVEAAAFAAALALCAAHRRGGAWLPTLAVPVAEGWRSHTNTAVPLWGGLLTGVHLGAAAVWIGALAHIVAAAVAWRGQRTAVWWAVTGYARLAGWLFTTVVATGTISALILVPPPALTSTTYGRLLLAKLALVGLAAGAALSARWWLRRGPDTLPRLTRATRVETATLGAVLAVTAVLVSAPPARSVTALPNPPPPTGVVEPLGTLAGQIGVAVQASHDQLVVRLSAPQTGDQYAPAAAQTFRLTARLLPAGGTAHAVALRGCGEGCYTAALGWGSGDNLLTLRAAAPGWAGGTVSLLIPWPVQPGAERLQRAVAALRTAGPITVYEQVTSNTVTPLPDLTVLHLSGAALLAGEPYATGVAAQAVTLRTTTQQTRLALGFPAARQWVQLVLDSHGRITEEQLSDDRHLIRRRFVYPGPDQP
jgi:copper transport protein